MKSILKTISFFLVLSIIIFSCDKEENNDIMFPVTYSLDTNKIVFTDYTCFTMENDELKKIPIQGTLDVVQFLLKTQKVYLYEYGFLREITLVDATNAKALTQEEDGSTTSHDFTYTIEDGKLRIDGLQTTLDPFYTLNDDNTRFTFTYCSAVSLRTRNGNNSVTFLTDICTQGHTDIMIREATAIQEYNLANGDSLAMWFTHEHYDRQ